ncbi:hypothetical protein CSKR_106922, partial [Clonorchis sinensis]
MGSHTNSPRLLSPRRRIRGYVSLEQTAEDGPDPPAIRSADEYQKATCTAPQCRGSVLSDLISPKSSPVLRRMQMSRLKWVLSPKRNHQMEHIMMSGRTEEEWLEANASISSLNSLDTLEKRRVLLPQQQPTNGHNHSPTRRLRHTSDSSEFGSVHMQTRSSFTSERKTLLRAILSKTFGRSNKQDRFEAEQNSSVYSNTQSAVRTDNQKRWNSFSAKSIKSAPCSPMFDVRNVTVKDEKQNYSRNYSAKKQEEYYSLCSNMLEVERHPLERIHALERINGLKGIDINPRSHEPVSSPSMCMGGSIRQAGRPSDQLSTLNGPAGEDNSALRGGSPKSRNETPPPSYFDLAKSETTKIPSDQNRPPQTIQNNANPPTALPSINNLPVHCDSCWRNRSALLRLSAHLHQSAATILRNDLGTGQTTIPTMLPPNLYHSPALRQVVLHRNGTCQRFGMKLGRTDGPDQITYIAMILPRSPACDAGLQVGDRILTINGSNVDSMTLESAIDLIRTTSRILQLTYEPRPFTSYLLTMIVRKQDGKVGIRLKSQEELQIDVVLPHSPAARVGLRAGQKVVGLNGHNVVYWDHSDAMKWLRAYPDEQDLLITVSEAPMQPEKEEQLDMHKQLTETSHHISENEISNETYVKHNMNLSRSNCSECSSFHDHCAEVVDHRLCKAAGSQLLHNDNTHCEYCAETSPNGCRPSSQGQSTKVPPQGERTSFPSQPLESNECNENAYQNRYSECIPLTNQKEMQNCIPLRLSFTVPSNHQCEGQTLDFGDPSEQHITSTGTQSCSSSLRSKFLITTATSPLCNETERR